MRYSYTAQRTKNSATEKADHCTFGHGYGQRRIPLAPLPKRLLEATIPPDAHAPEVFKTAHKNSVGGNAGERR
jgi:hypothetical protein